MTAGDREEDDKEDVLCSRELESISSVDTLAAVSASDPAAAAAAAAASPTPDVDLQSVPLDMFSAASTSKPASSLPSAIDVSSVVSMSTLTLLLLLFSSIFFLFIPSR